MMRAQFPHIEKVAIQPFILQSQLYRSVKDRTQVDRDLESLKKEKVLRIFKLNIGWDDHAIMFMGDYLKQVATAAKRFGSKNLQNVEVLEWFKRHVIESKLDVSIEHQELTCQLIDPNMYWFSIPNIGSILKGLSQGHLHESFSYDISSEKEKSNGSYGKKRTPISKPKKI